MSDQDVSSNVTIGSRSKSGDLFSSSSVSPSTSSSGSHGSAKSAVSECLGAWINYLQVLNSLCSSGHRLAQTISTLEQWGQCEPHGFQIQSLPQPQASSLVSTQFVTAWDDLARATAVATSTVKAHIVSVLQDFVATPSITFEQESDVQKVREHNQSIVMETAQTMINIQHQFCVASGDSFSSLMCCFVCQTPVGFQHDSECSMIQQPQFPRNQNSLCDPRSQTPSPHFGSLTMNFPKNERDLYRMPTDSHTRPMAFGSGSTQTSDHNCTMTEIRGPSPIQGFLENIRGPLPNPGHLLGRTPLTRGVRSPLNFPLFPSLNGQRRWSEAAAGEVKGESIFDAESHMRRWSMPWEASKTVKNTVTWQQTKLMPISKLAVPSKPNSQSTTPDSIWHSSVTSQDGLAEAIQLLSCRPSRIHPPQSALGLPFIEEPQTASNIATYEMWSDRTQERLPSIKFPRGKDDD